MLVMDARHVQKICELAMGIINLLVTEVWNWFCWRRCWRRDVRAASCQWGPPAAPPSLACGAHSPRVAHSPAGGPAALIREPSASSFGLHGPHPAGTLGTDTGDAQPGEGNLNPWWRLAATASACAPKGSAEPDRRHRLGLTDADACARRRGWKLPATSCRHCETAARLGAAVRVQLSGCAVTRTLGCPAQSTSSVSFHAILTQEHSSRVFRIDYCEMMLGASI